MKAPRGSRSKKRKRDGKGREQDGDSAGMQQKQIPRRDISRPRGVRAHVCTRFVPQCSGTRVTLRGGDKKKRREKKSQREVKKKKRTIEPAYE